MAKEDVGAKCNSSYSNLSGILNLRCLALMIEEVLRTISLNQSCWEIGIQVLIKIVLFRPVNRAIHSSIKKFKNSSTTHQVFAQFRN